MLNENNSKKLTIENVRGKLNGRYDMICGRVANHKDGSITEETGMTAYICIPSNTKEFVVSAENMNMSITAGIVYRTSKTGSNFKQGTTNQEQPVTTVERKDST